MTASRATRDSGTPSTMMPSGRRRARLRGPARRGARAPGRQGAALPVVGYHEQGALIVDRVHVHDARLAEERRPFPRQGPSPDQPELLGAGDDARRSTVGAQFGRREHGQQPDPLSRAPGDARRAARAAAGAQPAAQRRDAPSPGQPAPCRRGAARRAMDVRPSQRHGRDPHGHQAPRHRLGLRLGIEMRHQPAANGRAGPAGDEVGVLAGRAAGPPSPRTRPRVTHERPARRAASRAIAARPCWRPAQEKRDLDQGGRRRATRPTRAARDRRRS